MSVPRPAELSHHCLVLEHAAGQELEKIAIKHGCVVLHYPALRVAVCRIDWQVYRPVDRIGTRYLTALGVGERARLAVERWEGDG